MRVANGFLLFWMAVSCAAAPAFKSEQGEIAGVKFAWIKPRAWNQRVLIYAHDVRAEAEPLEATLSADDPMVQTFQTNGWMIATSSYRRNGLILADAVADLDALRAEIVRRFGPLDRVIVEGEGMGAMIGLLIAERPPEEVPLYQGVVAVDPAFEVREGFVHGSGLNLQPKIPVLFLSTRHEMAAARRYASVAVPASVRPFMPGLLMVNRDGRGNVNSAEKLFAVTTLDGWLDNPSATLPLPDATKDYLDATANAEPQPSRVVIDPDQHGFTAHVTKISATGGYILVDAQPEDFKTIGVQTNAFFRAAIRSHSFRVRFGKDASSLKRGEWGASYDANGFYWLSRNQLSGAALTGAKPGDAVHIGAYAVTEDVAKPED